MTQGVQLMAELPEQKIGDLTIRIDREMCIGSGNCTKVAPEVFKLDDEVTAAFEEPIGDVESDRVVEACSVCPVGALFVVDADGNRLVP